MDGQPALCRIRRARQPAALHNWSVLAHIRLSSIDLSDIQVKALEEGIPYQTLIASVLHKYVTGRLLEKSRRITGRPTRTPRKRAAG